MPLVGLTVLPLLLGWPPLVTPAHVVLTQMVIDPMCSFAFEAAPASASLMQRPPRPAAEGLLAGASLWRALAMGLVLLAALMGAMVLARGIGPALALDGTIDQQRTLVMSMLLAGNLGLVALYLTEGWTRPDWGSAAAAIYGLAATTAVAFWTLGLQWSAWSALLQLKPAPTGVLLGACAFTLALLVEAQRGLLKR